MRFCSDGSLSRSPPATLGSGASLLSPAPSPKTWDGYRGRIDADLLRSEGIDPNALFFICGPPSMIQDVAAMLAALGVPGSRVRYEQWW